MGREANGVWAMDVLGHDGSGDYSPGGRQSMPPSVFLSSATLGGNLCSPDRKRPGRMLNLFYIRDKETFQLKVHIVVHP